MNWFHAFSGFAPHSSDVREYSVRELGDRLREMGCKNVQETITTFLHACRSEMEKIGVRYAQGEGRKKIESLDVPSESLQQVRELYFAFGERRKNRNNLPAKNEHAEAEEPTDADETPCIISFKDAFRIIQERLPEYSQFLQEKNYLGIRRIMVNELPSEVFAKRHGRKIGILECRIEKAIDFFVTAFLSRRQWHSWNSIPSATMEKNLTPKEMVSQTVAELERCGKVGFGSLVCEHLIPDGSSKQHHCGFDSWSHAWHWLAKYRSRLFETIKTPDGEIHVTLPAKNFHAAVNVILRLYSIVEWRKKRLALKVKDSLQDVPRWRA